MDKLFYIQSTGRVTGNDAVWWRDDDKGYTSDLAEAGKYTEAMARSRITETDVAMACDAVDSLSHRCVLSHKAYALRTNCTEQCLFPAFLKNSA